MCTFRSEFINRFPNTQRLCLQFSVVVEYMTVISSIFFFFLLQNKHFFLFANCLSTETPVGLVKLHKAQVLTEDAVVPGWPVG